MKKRNRSKPLQPVGDILHRILAKNNIHLPRENVLLKKTWNQVVGPMTALQTRPDRLSKGTLYVKVSTSVWMHQLQFLKKDILEKFKNHWKQSDLPVDNIHFSVGPIKSAEDGIFFHPTTILLKEHDKALIEECLQLVCDQELKEILARVMSKEISRRRYLEHHKKGNLYV
jgi:hypothetical protein